MSGKPALPAAGAGADGSPPRRRSVRASGAAPLDAPDAGEDPDLRLIIDETDDREACVYTVMDRRTGKIVSQFRQGDMQRRLELGGYAAGDGVSVKI